MRLLSAVITVVILSVATVVQAKAAELVMFEEAGCNWCERWNREIGVLYANTAEGRLAPLRRVSLGAARPADLANISSVTFTPTFVVMEGGKEYGRMVGYPGENFFWPMLKSILSRLPGSIGLESANLRMN